MSYKAYNDIRIKGPWKLTYIENIELNIRSNEHAILNFKAIISEEEAIKIEGDLDTQAIQLCTIEDNKETSLFNGDIMEASINKENGVCTLDVTAFSATRRLEVKMESQSFQDTCMTYEELIRNVISKQNESAVICTSGSSTKIGIPIIQYQETDWEFIKRMASHFNTVVVHEISYDKPRFWFGLPEGKSQKLDDYVLCKVWTDKKVFNESVIENTGATLNNFCYYEVQTGDNFEVGDTVVLDGRTLRVYEKTGKMQQGLWTYNYKLGREKGLFEKRKNNNKISGMSIIGKVLDTKGELLKAHLEIDKSQDVGKAYWYSYTPPTGNSMYCMPKVGTNVSIYFGDEKEEHAKAISCVRNNGGSCSKTSDYNNRYFTTEHNKVMNLLPDQINFTGGKEGEPLKFSVRDDGIFVNSKQNFAISGGKNIRLKAGKQISLNAKGTINIGVATLEQIMISAQTSIQLNGLITIDAEINILGTKISVKGLEMEIPSIDDAPERKQLDKGKLALGILAAVAIAVVVAAVAAVALPALAVAAGVAGATAGFSLSTFAIVMVGASIPVTCKAIKDIKTGEASEWQDYAITSGTAALGTAVALIPGSGILKVFGVNKYIATVLGAGSMGAAGFFTTTATDSVLRNKESLGLMDDKVGLALSIVCNIIPDVAEWTRQGKLANKAGKVADDFNTEIKIEGKGEPGAGSVKTKIRLNPQVKLSKIFEEYGLSSSNSNINKLKQAIVQDPERYLNLILEDKGLTKQIIENPNVLTATIENTLPLFLSNGEGEVDTVGKWIFGVNPEFSY